MSSFGFQEIFALLIGIVVLLFPVAFIGFLITAIIRRTTMWWVLAGVTGLITVLSIIPVIFIGARAWKDGSDRAEAIMREQMELEREATLAETFTREVVCKEGIVRLSVPASWGDLTEEIGNEDASISYGSMVEGQYTILITEPRADIVGVFGEEDPFGELHTLVISQLSEGMENARNFPLETLSHPGAIHAVRTRVQGTVEGHNMTYMFFVFETRNHFHQLMFWTVDPDVESVMPVFEQTGATFRLVD